MTTEDSHDELPQHFDWRGMRWRRGLGGCYHPDKNGPHVGLRLRNECMVWWDSDDSSWRASLIPSSECKARSATQSTCGPTPQKALDLEVTIWLTTVLSLPGARDLLTELGLLSTEKHCRNPTGSNHNA